MKIMTGDGSELEDDPIGRETRVSFEPLIKRILTLEVDYILLRAKISELEYKFAVHAIGETGGETNGI